LACLWVPTAHANMICGKLERRFTPWGPFMSAHSRPPPEAYPRRVLLAVTGLTPQIVTETVYWLALKQKPAFVPTEICLITTRQGEENARLSLLSDNPGWFQRLRQGFSLPEIAFDASRIFVIVGPDGNPLEDIVTEADNVAVADFITEKVRAVTADPEASLHVSIAGGRKTMGFYLGYALSLFGRAQDRLSHVLVSAPFESLPDFYYPAAGERVIHDRDGRPLDASKAQVSLADIPFVRLRDGLPERLLAGGARFSEAVEEAQKALPPVALHIEPATLTAIAGGTTFQLEPSLFALYWMLGEKCRTADRGVLRDNEEGIRNELLAYYGRLVNPNSGAYERAEKAYRHFSRENFDQTKAKLNRALTRALGERLAAPYRIVRLEREPGRKAHRYGLLLPPEAITIAP
jgi:CRISPR-associated protein (TIGR02584 family)